MDQDPDLGGDANTLRYRAWQCAHGLDARELPLLAEREKYFLLTSPYYRTRPSPFIEPAQSVARTLASRAADPFWQARYYALNVPGKSFFIQVDLFAVDSLSAARGFVGVVPDPSV